jgi:pimeloyl-ACP methyl ester carboxylesterase
MLMISRPAARREDVLRSQALVPAAETGYVAGAGHLVAGDRNDRFADAISRFLATILAGPTPIDH